MDHSQFSWIEEVKELTDVADVNEHIKSGWIIINIYNAQAQTNSCIQTAHQQVFTLAWSKNNVLNSDLTSRYDDDWKDYSL